MQQHPTIGVLTTTFGGLYFGLILEGVSRRAAQAGARVVAIETIDIGTFTLDPDQPPEFDHQVAWDHLSGAVVILNAVPPKYLHALRDIGIPVVLISEQVDGFPCPVVRPDNSGGIRSAIRHLLSHGHRTFAFAGNPRQQDMVERHRAFQQELSEQGLPVDSGLFFDTVNNQEAGGRHVAAELVSRGLPATAVLVGNDLCAIGVIRGLTEAGYRVPQDVAVVGFDDIVEASFQTPGLTTVRHRFEDLGATAADLVLRQVAGEDIPPGHVDVPTTLVRRGSCGCRETLASSPDRTPPPRNRSEFVTGLVSILTTDGASDEDTASLTRAAETCAEVIDAALRGDPVSDLTHLREDFARTYRLDKRPERLIEAMRHVRDYGRDTLAALATRPSGDRRRQVEDSVQEMVLTLGQAQALAQFQDSAHFRSAFGAQYQVSMELLRSHVQAPQALTWLTGTTVRAGCLGLWSDRDQRTAPGPDRYLDIAGLFGLPHHRRLRHHLPIRSFPPEDLLTHLDPATRQVVFVAPLKERSSDRGMVALVGPVEPWAPTGRDTISQWAALLTIALDHESVLTSLRERDDRLQHAALHDELTGLPNRAQFLDRIREAIRRAVDDPRHQFAVVMLDLDDFKVVNDSLGHVAGDEILVQVATRLRSILDSTAVAARLSGDEFAVLVEDHRPSAPPQHPHLSLLTRLREVLAAPYTVQGQQIVLTASIGITLHTDEGQQAEDLLRDADTATYTAKATEKGSHSVFAPSMHTRAIQRLQTEAELRHAIDHRQLEAHYQPVVRLPEGLPIGFEALIRWRHPDRGLIPPGQFLPTAIASGLILPIDQWMLAEACRQLRSWQAAGLASPTMRISVNVSNRHFWHGQLLDNVRDTLERTGLPASSLALEITEGVVMNDAVQARKLLRDIHELGVHVHMDDFGTGYSSLEVLHRLPLDALKIDRSFVAAMGTTTKSTELVRTIALMGANLGLELVAEGIETPAQKDNLAQLGCDYGQGYWFSPPIPAGQTETYLALARALPRQRTTAPPLPDRTPR